MDRQIVDPDPGKSYNRAISTGDPHFEMEKNKYTSQPSKSKLDSKL